ncbi:T9SS type A sorting domain-containing protein [Fluviicola chungangensis]|uniref:Omp28-related outer membrane protein n=1 Tax=Fluviicola chungangensis TaxID=2597671 RepID=A0A556MGZ2_9FLAO|nr:T9SS type A sorting domain-containing protein [Fluviicola chungangensis]TSJ39092.1 Omp28-related outer membrane protein [Fluviicola chungangensis]
MKKQLLTLGFLSSLVTFGQTFTDNFDSYTAGQKLCPQSGGAWTTWSNAPGGTEDVLVSNADAVSGSNSLYFSTSAQAGGPTDLVRNFGVLNTGQFDMDFNIKVETGKAGYFNLQKNATIGQVWAMDCFFNDNGSLVINNQDGLNFTGASYPQNTWFNFHLSINFNTNNWEVFIDNVSVGSFSNPVNQIASIDIYPTDQNAPYSCGYFIDDFHTVITPYTLPSVNGAINGLSFDQGTLAGNVVTPKVVVRNLGTTPITSFEMDVDYNGNNVHQAFTGLNIASLATTTVTLTGTLTLASGTMPMIATISNVNNAGADMDANDDVLSISLSPLTPAVGKMVVGEEGTGTWCQWCPRGAVFMDMMQTKYDQYWAGIAVHNGDPMVVTEYDAGIGGLVSGYPSALVDRMSVIDPSEMEGDFLTRVQVAPTALITNGATWNSTTRELKVSTSANFQSSATSSYKLGIVLTEDEVTGTSSNYNQANAYAGGGNGVMGGFESLPNPVPAAQMVYDHVARAIEPSFTGYANSFPATVNAGETHTITATFILPATWDETKIHIVGLLFNPAGKIDNAGKATITEAVANGFVSGTDVTAGLNNLSQIDDLVQVYPNPATTAVSVSLQMTEQSEVTISVTDIAGKEISSKNYGQMNGASVITINTNNTPAGVYFVNVKMNNAITQKKVIIQ